MSKGKLLAVSLVWLVLLLIGAAAWRLVVSPSLKPRVVTESRYDHSVTVAVDSFSGYCVLRSETLRERLAAARIKFSTQDDGADYAARLQALERGDVQLAAFTIDALVKVCAERGELPGVIVAVIDETRGADAMVAYKSSVPNVDALNRSQTRFLLTPDSPSETLARVVMTHFNLDAIGDQNFVECRDAEEVFQQYKRAKPGTTDVYVLWEPYISRILQNPAMHVVLDSSRFRGYIVDVLVASNDFVAKNPEVVQTVVENYFEAFAHHQPTMVQLVQQDGKLTLDQAQRLVDGVWWKNSQENFAHLGLVQGHQLQHLEDMIGNITRVLLDSHAIQKDPTGGEHHRLYYARPLANLQASDFRPGGAGASLPEIRQEQVELRALSDAEWRQLHETGTLGVPDLIFAAGSPRLTERSQRILGELVGKLENWPDHYLLIRGNAARRGDPEANRRLAEERAQAAAEYLVQQGVDANRVRAVGGDPNGGRSVSFVFGLPGE